MRLRFKLRGESFRGKKLDTVSVQTGEAFLDTFVICTITGLVLGVTGVIAPGISGNVLPLYAFESVWPPMDKVQ